MTNAATQVLDVAPAHSVDEALDPMANVTEEVGSGHVAARNMSNWISRATATVIGGVYRTQDAAELRSEFASAMLRDAIIQTEPPKMKDASAMIIDGQMESERLNNLDIAIPIPAELPVLTTSQLLELERRLGDLMSRLEDEIQRAEGEVQRRKEQQAEQQKREEIMNSNRFGKYTNNDEWAQQMRGRIEKRLHKKHGFSALPERQRKALDSVLLAPLKTRKMNPEAMENLEDDMAMGQPTHSDPFSDPSGGTPTFGGGRM